MAGFSIRKMLRMPATYFSLRRIEWWQRTSQPPIEFDPEEVDRLGDLIVAGPPKFLVRNQERLSKLIANMPARLTVRLMAAIERRAPNHMKKIFEGHPSLKQWYSHIQNVAAITDLFAPERIHLLRQAVKQLAGETGATGGTDRRSSGKGSAHARQ